MVLRPTSTGLHLDPLLRAQKSSRLGDLHGEVIAIVQKNSERVSQAVAELRKRAESEDSANPARAAALPPPQADPFAALEELG